MMQLCSLKFAMFHVFEKFFSAQGSLQLIESYPERLSSRKIILQKDYPPERLSSRKIILQKDYPPERLSFDKGQ